MNTAPTHPIIASSILRVHDVPSSSPSKRERLARARAAVIAQFGARVLVELERATTAARDDDDDLDDDDNGDHDATCVERRRRSR